jgi:ferric-dicitrate binding protein FerR (iron transport regulator)
MTSRDFTIEELLHHPLFRQWVLQQDAAAAAYWQQWLQQHPHKKEEVDKAREMLLLIGAGTQAPSPQDATETWERILESIDKAAAPAPSGVRPLNIRRLLPYAAILTGILIVAAAAILFFRSGSVQYATAMGEMRTIELPDHSIVRLNVNSTLRYSRKWEGQGPREVWLGGEAFFTVQHRQDNRRFIVHTNDVDIQVVGTEFNVNTRRVKTQVVLSKGAVRLMLNKGPEQAPITMKPGDMVTYSASTAELTNKKVDPSAYSSWRTGVLSFEETPVTEVIRSIQDNLGISITLEDESLGAQTYTGSIPMNNVEVFFKTLSRSFNIHIQQTGANTYVISQPKE